MAVISEEREQRHWQQARKLILEEAGVAAVSWQLRVALLKDSQHHKRFQHGCYLLAPGS